MKRLLLAVVALLVVAFPSIGQAAPTQTAEPRPKPTPTATPSVSPKKQTSKKKNASVDEQAAKTSDTTTKHVGEPRPIKNFPADVSPSPGKSPATKAQTGEPRPSSTPKPKTTGRPNE